MYTEKEELSNAPFLKKLKDAPRAGMTVPDGYFDAMEESVLAKIAAQKVHEKQEKQATQSSAWSWSVWSRSKFIAAAASVVLLGLLVGLWWKSTPATSSIAFDGTAPVEITPEEAEAYIMQHLNTLEDEELGVLADATPFTGTKVKEAAADTELPSDEEADDLLKDMTDEELEKLLN